MVVDMTKGSVGGAEDVMGPEEAVGGAEGAVVDFNK